MNKHVTISEFEERNSSFIKKRKNGDKTFRAKVIFKYGNKQVIEILDVIIQKTTWESNTIRISESDAINANNLHTEFNPHYDNINFSITSENNLVIHGDSPKLGDYEVTLICI